MKIRARKVINWLRVELKKYQDPWQLFTAFREKFKIGGVVEIAPFEFLCGAIHVSVHHYTRWECVNKTVWAPFLQYSRALLVDQLQMEQVFPRALCLMILEYTTDHPAMFGFSEGQEWFGVIDFRWL